MLGSAIGCSVLWLDYLVVAAQDEVQNYHHVSIEKQRERGPHTHSTTQYSRARRDTYTATTHTLQLMFTSASAYGSSYMDRKFLYTFVLQIKQHNEKNLQVSWHLLLSGLGQSQYIVLWHSYQNYKLVNRAIGVS